MIVGVDEAGRGCVLGPMVVCAIGTKEKDFKFFKMIGVTDSKLLSKKKRTFLALKIKKISKYSFVEVSPSEIDCFRKTYSLNRITLMKFGEAVSNLGLEEIEKIYVDSCDVKAERFGEELKKILSFERIHSEHGADSKYLIVSAASILAKVKRDERIEEIKRKIGFDFGSGYPSDEKTKEFLREWYENHKSFPDFVRKSWETVKRFQQLDFYFRDIIKKP